MTLAPDRRDAAAACGLTPASVRDDYLQDDEGDTQSEVECDGNDSARAAKALDPGVTQSLKRKCCEAHTERDPYGCVAGK